MALVTTENRWLILLIACSLMATVALRFLELGSMVVWHDEVFSIARVFGITHGQLNVAINDVQVHDVAYLQRLQGPQPGHGLAETFQALQEHPEHSPLYYLTAWAVSDWAERPIVALRGTSAALSLLLFPAIFWLARELADRRYAWLALALSATSPVFFLYAREARQYALWLVLITAASAALLRALRSRHARDFLIYGVLLALALYTHLLTGLVMLAHALYLVMLLYPQPTELFRLGRQAALVWGAVLIVFLPWMQIILENLEAVRGFTSWLTEEASLANLFASWQGHLFRLFVDLPGMEPFWPLGALLLLAALAWYFRRAPRKPRLFIGMIIVASLIIVVLPDLLLGGRRSLEARYLLQLLLAVELVLAWVLAQGLASPEPNRRRISLAVFVLLLGFGLVSQYSITFADSWWTKSLSAENAAFARLVNASEKPLLVGSHHAVSDGEILSLAHSLDSHVGVMMDGYVKPLVIPSGYSRLFALLPSGRLRRTLEKDHRLEPFQDSWKWFVAIPLNSDSPNRRY